MGDGEVFYDTEIAPLLRQAATLAQSKGMAFVSAVEYAPGDVARTRWFAQESGLQLRMVDALIQSRGNLDFFLMSLYRAGIDMSACAFVHPTMREPVKGKEVSDG